MESISKMEQLIKILRERFDRMDAEEMNGSSINRCRLCGHEWPFRTKNPHPIKCPSCRSTLWDNPDVRKHICRRCDHEWFSLDEHPIRCPSCRLKTWDAPYLMVRCTRCNTVWKDAMRIQKSFRCPMCGPISMDEVKTLSRNVLEPKPMKNGKSLTDIGECLTDRLLSADINGRRTILENEVFYPDKIEIICRFMDGADPFSLAKDMHLPLNDVMMTVGPLASRCEKEGISWISS